MPDIILAQEEQLPAGTQIRYRDMGDETFALVGAIGGTVTIQGTAAVTMTHVEKLVGTNVSVLTANPNRQYLLIINDSDTVIYLNLGGASTPNQGVRLNANGGSYEMSAQTGNLYRGAVNASAAGGAADKLLLVTEGV